jgi:hypothetical protein
MTPLPRPLSLLCMLVALTVGGAGCRTESVGREGWTVVPFFEPRKMPPPVEPVVVTLSSRQARPGDEITISVKPPLHAVPTVHFNDRPLPATASLKGDTLVVTIPSGAKSGAFALKVDSGTFSSPELTIISP